MSYSAAAAIALSLASAPTVPSAVAVAVSPAMSMIVVAAITAVAMLDITEAQTYGDGRADIGGIAITRVVGIVGGVRRCVYASGQARGQESCSDAAFYR